MTVRRFKVRTGTQVFAGGKLYGSGKAFEVDDADFDAAQQIQGWLDAGWVTEVQRSRTPKRARRARSKRT